MTRLLSSIRPDRAGGGRGKQDVLSAMPNKGCFFANRQARLANYPHLVLPAMQPGV